MKTYTEEFKKTIVELYENGNKNKSELAKRIWHIRRKCKSMD